MKRCYFKGIAESTSVEGNYIRQQHPEVNFKRCKHKCAGYEDYGTCEYYTLVDLNPIIEETIEDSSRDLSGRLEDIGV